jgi:hypothetical protein
MNTFKNYIINEGLFDFFDKPSKHEENDPLYQAILELKTKKNELEDNIIESNILMMQKNL